MSRYALVACISYGYSGLLVNDSKRLVFLPEFSMFWKFFLPSPGTIEEWSAANPLLRENLRLGGYSKMDRLSGIRTRPRDRKKIMICPHHSLGRSGEGVSISNFLKYSDFFLELPARYPEIDFVFRPHPLLFPRLQTPEWWGEKKTREYKEKMSAFSNVEFQEGGDYFDSFVNSDAMIHDCGSFLAEYFYTGRPQCYLVESAEAVDREFTTFGKELISYTNPVLSESEIIKFIEDTVIAGRDLVADDRAKFASESVCLFYPRASDRVVGEIKESLEI